MANMWFLCIVFLITVLRLFHVKDTDCEKDLIKPNRWQNDVKTSSFDLICKDLWLLQFNGESVSKRKQAEIVDQFMMN